MSFALEFEAEGYHSIYARMVGWLVQTMSTLLLALCSKSSIHSKTERWVCLNKGVVFALRLSTTLITTCYPKW